MKKVVMLFVATLWVLSACAQKSKHPAPDLVPINVTEYYATYTSDSVPTVFRSAVSQYYNKGLPIYSIGLPKNTLSEITDGAVATQRVQDTTFIKTHAVPFADVCQYLYNLSLFAKAKDRMPKVFLIFMKNGYTIQYGVLYVHFANNRWCPTGKLCGEPIAFTTPVQLFCLK